MSHWRLAGLYFFYFALLGAIMPFWNLYLYAQGYNARDIGLLGAVMMGTKVVSPYMLGWLADVTRRPMLTIQWSNLAAFLFFLPIFMLGGEQGEGQGSRTLHMGLIIAAFTFFWNAVIAQYEAVTMLTLGNHYQKYGRIRAWGSVGFIASVSLLGWLFETLEINALPWVVALLLLTIWLSSLGTGEPRTSPQPENLHGLGSIIFKPSVLAFFAGCFLVKFAHGPYYTFYSIYLDGYGYSTTSIGILWSIGVIAELALFMFMGRLLAHYSLRAILSISLVAGIIRWAVIGYFPENLLLIVLAQIAHALTFASYHAAAVEWVRRKFGEHHQGQGQALYSALSFGAGGAVGAIVSGLLWSDTPSANWQLTWMIASLASVAGLLLFAFFAANPSAETQSEAKTKRERSNA
ncbi:MAG: MFS transporter [Gammaproteobacteria bacterium]|nr:MFS transporter [Gammaproteobacteria bacterium]